MLRICLGFALLVCSGAGLAHTIAIIGTGDVAAALGPRFGELGHTVTYGSRTPQSEKATRLVARTPGDASADLPAQAAKPADIVVLAVPATVVVQVVKGLGDVSGKILIDPTNHFAFTDRQGVEPTSDESMGMLIQLAAPQAKVVKAFNLLSHRAMTDPSVAGGPMTVPIAGDDAGAKETVAALIHSLGLESWDAGPIRTARQLEGMLMPFFNARLQGRPFNFYFRPEPQAASAPEGP